MRSARVLLCCSVIAAALVLTTATSSAQPTAFSLKLGERVIDPERIAGAWETKVSRDKVVGISIGIGTSVNAAVAQLRGQPQTVISLSLDTYARTNGKSDMVAPQHLVYSAGGGSTTSWNSDWSHGIADATLVISSGVLTFRQSGRDAVNLFLTYDPSSMAWRGWYESPFFKGEVELTRPLPDVPARTPAGTWAQSIEIGINELGISSPGADDVQMQCLHIALARDDRLVLWGDMLHWFINPRSEAGGQRDGSTLREMYGVRYYDTDSSRSDRSWKFRFANATWSYKVTGHLSPDGEKFEGELSEHEGNGIEPTDRPQLFTWRRAVAPDECGAADLGPFWG